MYLQRRILLWKMNLLPASAFGDSSICAIFGNRQNQSFTLAFRRSGNKCFYVSGIKKVSPRFSAGAKKGLRRKKRHKRGLEKEHIARNAVPYKGGNVTYRRKHRGTAFLREKERVFVCSYYIGAGRKKKYSVGIQSENFSRMKPERRPGSRARK